MFCVAGTGRLRLGTQLGYTTPNLEVVHGLRQSAFHLFFAPLDRATRVSVRSS